MWGADIEVPVQVPYKSPGALRSVGDAVPQFASGLKVIELLLNVESTFLPGAITPNTPLALVALEAKVPLTAIRCQLDGMDGDVFSATPTTKVPAQFAGYCAPLTWLSFPEETTYRTSRLLA